MTDSFRAQYSEDFIAKHAQLRDALKDNEVPAYYANVTARNILTGQVTDQTLTWLLQALSTSTEAVQPLTAEQHCQDLSKAYSWLSLWQYANYLLEQCQGIENETQAFQKAKEVLASDAYLVSDVEGEAYYSHHLYS
ncbi:hypothetical protein Lepto7375DRAFT_7265 [Leptolyngbya sp. PCC 7375]|nr:hypothetical protein Lepto7375DRAFT_7265 [Leptolyngbya sp. PCC 7375]